jgi:hypothetical protein
MSPRTISEVTPRANPAMARPPVEVKNPLMPLVEDLARREKTPFVMTSVGRRGRNLLGWETGPTMHFGPDELS